MQYRPVCNIKPGAASVGSQLDMVCQLNHLKRWTDVYLSALRSKWDTMYCITEKVQIYYKPVVLAITILS